MIGNVLIFILFLYFLLRLFCSSVDFRVFFMFFCFVHGLLQDFEMSFVFRLMMFCSVLTICSPQK